MDSEDLFVDASTRRNMPLPGRMRPRAWNSFVGHEELVSILKNKGAHSMILYGPPGCGKTTLARILAESSGYPYDSLSAVSAGLKEVRDVIKKGRESLSLGKPHILFIDEIHRFSKTQQDALLEAVESGWIILIGATTENPSFEVIGPLLSRCQVYRLKALGDGELTSILHRALQEDSALQEVRLTEEARAILLEAAGGDARKMLRMAEVAAMGVLRKQGSHRRQDEENQQENREEDEEHPVITRKEMEEVLQHALRSYDKTGENHYDFVSAFIKSMRASDPDAAVLYLACMIEAGEDPLFIARRMIIFASEDVGNAHPQALPMALAAFQALERIGMPEGRIILSHAATFLATSPKSNAAYLAIGEAQARVRGRRVVIPNYLRNAPTKTHRAEGAGEGYLYPHDFPGNFAAQSCLPPGFERDQFYFPREQGQEARFKERLKSLWPDRKYD